MTEWEIKVICPKGHSNKIVLYYNEYELQFMCTICDNNIWWEPGEKELEKNGVTLC